MNEQHVIEILLVEDNPNDVELTIRALNKHKLVNKVHVVQDGEEALDFMFCRGKYSNRDEKRQPRVILLDLKLPKVSGLEVLEELKGNDKTRHVPVVVLTTSRAEQDMVDSYRLGVNSYIVKPVNFQKFIDSVAEIGLYWLLLNEIPN
ncbi:MAG: response regulator [Bacteroidetes bacterium]|nr:response regulator [Bacteroidota bacterium]